MFIFLYFNFVSHSRICFPDFDYVLLNDFKHEYVGKKICKCWGPRHRAPLKYTLNILSLNMARRIINYLAVFFLWFPLYCTPLIHQQVLKPSRHFPSYTVHETSDGRFFECSDCPSSYKHYNHLTEHRKAVHPGPFKCPQCEFITKDRKYLPLHVKSMHSDDLLLSCDLCDFTYRWKFSIVRHMAKYHDGDKPFKCSQCVYASVGRREYIDHFNTVHLKLRPYECTDCDYSAGRKTTLRTHIKLVHERIKKNACTICNYATGLAGNLRNHMRRVHKAQLWDILHLTSKLSWIPKLQ